MAALESAGVVDDARLAGLRACSLSERGWGDSAIVSRLEQEGIPAAAAAAAVAGLEPEARRAAALAARAGDVRSSWRLLARRGFAPESIEDAVGTLDEGR